MTHRAPSSLRCAIYTRKSSEEGLDMAFNSLDAQREACMDYIKSQRHQGWNPLSDKYDDGGFSGGTTDRPGLNRLLSAIEAGRVDIVVVYKVDRLSRSLADFARLMQLFDEHRVSFVSVTQQFSTTSSMGRLTLNMLLSFAQFEREVAGERIRDKIAATMKKGVWVCGQPPLGYRVPRDAGSGATTSLGEPLTSRVLRIVPEEARVVRLIYDTYLQTGSLLDVARRMNTLGHTTKRWTSTRGKTHGGNPMCTGYIHRVLTNPVYIGKIAHTRRIPGERSCTTQTDVHDGLHEPIIARETWDRVQERMARIERSAAYDAAEGWKHTHLLKGKLKAADGRAMSPAHVTKQRASGVTTRVPYYVSQRAIKQGYAVCPLKSINARHVDDLVRSLVLDHAASTGRQWPVDDPSKRDLAIRGLIERVVVTPESLAIELVSERLEALATTQPATPRRGREKPGHPEASRAAAPFRPEVSERGRLTILTLAIQIKKLDGRRMLVGPDGEDLLASHGIDHSRQPNPTLVRALAQAHAWHRELLEAGGTIDALARRHGTRECRVRHLLPLTHLAPSIIHAILTGGHRERMSLGRLLRAAEHLDWSRQAASLRLHR